MASSIEIPTIRSNGNQDENDAYLPDDEKEDYSPLVVGSDQPTIEGSVSASSSSSPVMILSLLDGYGQKIAIITCMVIVLIYGTVMILEGKNGTLFFDIHIHILAISSIVESNRWHMAQPQSHQNYIRCLTEMSVCMFRIPNDPPIIDIVKKSCRCGLKCDNMYYSITTKIII
jgi:hypothetical protein